MKEKIQKFLKTAKKEDTLSIDYTPPAVIDSIFKELGYAPDDDVQTNGWSVDFWMYYYNEDGTEEIMFSGSWWSGNYQITKTE